MAKVTGSISASDGDHGATGLFNVTGDRELDLDIIYDVPVKISVILGKTKMTIGQLLRMENGNVIELERKVGEVVDIRVNDRVVARGEIVIVDENVGVTLTEIIKNDQ